MEQYPRLFIKAGLVYALFGAILGMGMALDPGMGARIRFVHIHFNLLGFLTMMVAGVAFHVLPRFNARPVPWPQGVKYQFYLQNIGLVGMAAVHASGGAWKGGQSLFILFAGLAAVAIAFMFYNLYFVLTPQKELQKPIRITGDMKVAAVLEMFPESLPIFLQSGFSALTNPVARSTFARVVTIDQASEKHGVDKAEFVRKLNAEVFAKPGAATSPPPEPGTEASPEGKVIAKGEACRPDTLVGSLIKVYPSTKAIFEKHYGEGCFSCPGQIFETVEQTARMHNVDPNLILGEINEAIQAARD